MEEKEVVEKAAGEARALAEDASTEVAAA